MSLAVCYSLLALVPYVLVWRLVDGMLNDRGLTAGQVWQWVGLAALALALKIALQLTSGLLSHQAAFRLLFDLRRRVIERVGRLPLSVCHQHTSARLKKIISDDIGRIETFVAHHLPDMAAAIVTPPAAALLLFFFDWRLALVALIPLPVAILMQCWIFRGFSGRIGDYHRVVADLHTSITDFVKSMPLVKTFNMTVDSHRRYARAVDEHYQLVSGWLRDTRTPMALFKISIDIGLLCLMPVGIWLFAQGEVTLATLFMFLLLGVGLMEPLFNLLQFAGMFSELLKGVENIRDFATMPVQQEGGQWATLKHYDIRFEQVGFTHGNSQKATLENLSFTARQHQITAIVGPSGAGKTTAAQLIPRLYEYQRGEVLIGDVPITAMPLEQLMSLVSVVFQDVFIFEETVENNIRMRNTALSESQIRAAARAACADDFIRALPQGYDTPIRPGMLSGGQAQRLAIARAIARNAPILILDEATAFSDARNEALIQQALSALMQGKTVLVIAHRLNTLTEVDKIVVMSQGANVAEGPHAELLAACPLYLHMWQAHQQAREWHLPVRQPEVVHE
ncbi:ABC transporter ATP-binding protein [Erwinia sp. S38]|uniref:ABC transporter ATP-binding protein n=1 Tax=Erwinia sp. S38 TaxID=2769338 RepID=UPI00190C968D|nr:ABC transporter ATP-binding protein [Erwinia sp. S38]